MVTFERDGTPLIEGKKKISLPFFRHFFSDKQKQAGFYLKGGGLSSKSRRAFKNRTPCF
jgi:hypothetical protein